MKLSKLDAVAIAIPWISGISGAAIAYKIQNWSFRSRWCIGITWLLFQTKFVLFKFAAPRYTNLLPNVWRDPLLSMYWSGIVSTISMLQPHSIAAMFKGSDYYKIHGIKNLKQALMTGLFTGQIYFGETLSQKNAFTSRIVILKQSLKFVSLFSVARMICTYLKNNPNTMKTVKSNIVFEMELLGFLLSIAMCLSNIESYLMGMIIAPFDVEFKMVPPYDPFIYFSTSFRDFWKGWSRPSGEMLKYAVYEPLNGRSNNVIATAALFQLNNSTHWDISQDLFGEKCVKDWTQVFVILGLAVSAEIALEEKTEKKYKHKWWWKAMGCLAFHSVMIPVCYIVQRKAIPISIEMMNNTFLIGK
eukprot:158044_1